MVVISVVFLWNYGQYQGAWGVWWRLADPGTAVNMLVWISARYSKDRTPNLYCASTSGELSYIVADDGTGRKMLWRVWRCRLSSRTLAKNQPLVVDVGEDSTYFSFFILNVVFAILTFAFLRSAECCNVLSELSLKRNRRSGNARNANWNGETTEHDEESSR